MNTDMLTHHFARLEMMMAEEKGIDLSYEDAIKLVQSQKQVGYLRQGSYIQRVERLKIKVMTQATMHSHLVLEEVIYQLQKKGAIVDPCIVDDLITCIKTHARVTLKK